MEEEKQVPEWFDGTYEEWLACLEDEEQASKAEKWFLEHQNDGSWRNAENGMEILADDAPDYVIAYAERYNKDQDEFDYSVKLKNQLSSK